METNILYRRVPSSPSDFDRVIDEATNTTVEQRRFALDKRIHRLVNEHPIYHHPYSELD